MSRRSAGNGETGRAFTQARAVQVGLRCLALLGLALLALAAFGAADGFGQARVQSPENRSPENRSAALENQSESARNTSEKAIVGVAPRVPISSQVDAEPASSTHGFHPAGLPAGYESAGALPAGAFSTRILAAVQQGRADGVFPVVSEGLSRRVPFGYKKPTLYCEPLRASLIRLEPGETVWAAIPADPVSWSVQLSQTGPGGITPIVVVKPLAEEAIRTNLFITTDRRIYEVLLESGSLEARREVTSASQSSILEFYYPEDIIQQFDTVAFGERRPLPPRHPRMVNHPVVTSTVPFPPPLSTDSSPRLPLHGMRFTYEWRKDRGFPWEPASVFDDGAHVYIILPESARHEASAALFVKGLNGENTMLEYAVREGRIITDRVFREAQFVYAEPSGRRNSKTYALTIRNTAR